MAWCAGRAFDGREEDGDGFSLSIGKRTTAIANHIMIVAVMIVQIHI
jgi:hypothetical protein